MARLPEDDEDGDYSIEVAPRNEGMHPTMELDTSEFQNMEQSGFAQTKPNRVIQVDGGATFPLNPGWSHDHEPEGSVVIDDTPSVVVAPAPAPAPLPARAPAPAPQAPRIAVLAEPRRTGAWLVVAVYLLAATALALAVYERYVA